MMEGSERPSQKGLVAAIIFASVAISGSLIYLGMQMSSSGLSANIAADEVSDAEIEKLIQDLRNGNLGEQAAPSLPTEKDVLFDDDAYLGDKNAPVTLVEFSDYQCPFCNRHFTQTFSQLKKDYVDTGKIAYVYRDYPLSFHADALPAAVAAECVREQKGDQAYFRMHEKIFTGVSATGTIPAEVLKGYASEIGVNMSQYQSCLDSPERVAEVNADMATGSRYGINGTPGFIISNGETSRSISGAQPYANFKAEIDALLK